MGIPVLPSLRQCSTFQHCQCTIHQTNGRCSLSCPSPVQPGLATTSSAGQRLPEAAGYGCVLVLQRHLPALTSCSNTEISGAVVSWKINLQPAGNRTSLISKQHLSLGCVGFPVWWPPVCPHCFLLLEEVEVKLRICQSQDTASRQGSLRHGFKLFLLPGNRNQSIQALC